MCRKDRVYRVQESSIIKLINISLSYFFSTSARLFGLKKTTQSNKIRTDAILLRMTGPNEESSKMPLTNNSLNLIRLLYLTYFLAIGCIQPFLSVYYHSLGFSGTQIGLIGSISPFASFVVAPFWGRLSDKSESPFPVLYLTSAISVVGTLLLYFFRDVQQVMIIVCITALFEAPVKPLIDSLVVS